MKCRFPCVGNGVVCVGVLLAIAISSVGCAGRTYRAASLPVSLSAPVALDLDSVNLSGLSTPSVSVDVIQPGDVLDISMLSDYERLIASVTPVRVGDDGIVVIPLVGKVSVGGMEVERAEKAINDESINRGIFRNPCITVSMKQCRTCKVSVVGAVNKPGTHELPRGSSSLMAAIMAAEGLTKEAGAEVEIRHTDSRTAAMPQQVVNTADGRASLVSYQQSQPIVTRVNLLAAANGSVQTPDLRDGDVVQVTKRTLPPIHVIGLVAKSGEFPYPTNQDIRVLDALALAGGVSNPVAEDVVVIRHMPNSKEPVRIAVSIQAAKNGRDNLLLAPGDTVSVEQTPFTAAVYALQTIVRFSIGGTLSWF